MKASIVVGVCSVLMVCKCAAGVSCGEGQYCSWCVFSFDGVYVMQESAVVKVSIVVGVCSVLMVCKCAAGVSCGEGQYCSWCVFSFDGVYVMQEKAETVRRQQEAQRRMNQELDALKVNISIPF